VGKLRHEKRGTVHALSQRFSVGRSPRNTLLLREGFASTAHALIEWTSEGWCVRDLGSTNGTFVDGERLPQAGRRAVLAGARIAFGDPADIFILDDASGPEILAVHLGSGQTVAAEGRILALPDGDRPELSVYEKNGVWVVDRASDGSITKLDPQAVVLVGGEPWRLEVPVSLDATPLHDGPSLGMIGLRFVVSSDEEDVDITIVHTRREILLERREHSYLLLTLARHRLSDSDRPVSERGWIERNQLLRMLAIGGDRLNVHIHRARQQFLSARVSGGAGIVEVRGSFRRIGVEQLEVRRSDRERGRSRR
jgi:FHA domain-containing protein